MERNSKWYITNESDIAFLHRNRIIDDDIANALSEILNATEVPIVFNLDKRLVARLDNPEINKWGSSAHLNWVSI